MTRIDWTALALKLYAVLIALGAIFEIASLLVFFAGVLNNVYGNSTIPLSGLITTSIGVLIPILIALIFWRKSNAIATWIWRDYEDLEKTENQTLQLPPASHLNIKAGILTAIGLYIFLTGLPALINRLTDLLPVIELMSSTRIITGIEENAFKLLIPLLARVIQVLLSAILIVAPKRVLAFLDGAQETWDLIAEE